MLMLDTRTDGYSLWWQKELHCSLKRSPWSNLVLSFQLAIRAFGLLQASGELPSGAAQCLIRVQWWPPTEVRIKSSQPTIPPPSSASGLGEPPASPTSAESRDGGSPPECSITSTAAPRTNARFATTAASSTRSSSARATACRCRAPICGQRCSARRSI